MNIVLQGVLCEELERNLQKQALFNRELLKYPKGSLVVVMIHGDKYLYRKYREKDKVISIYIGPVGSEEANKAYEDRKQFLKLKQVIKELKEEEKNLRKMLKTYGKI